MPGNSVDLVLRLVADTKQATSQISAAKGQAGGLRSALLPIGGIMAGAFAVSTVIDWGAAVVGEASEAQQAAGAVETVFGDASDQVTQLGTKAAESAGLAADEYGNLAAVLGTQLKSRGIEDIVSTSDDLIQIGADLAATYGGTTEEAVGALGATLRGEFDSAERFGLALSAAQVNAKAVELGLADTTSEVDAQAKAQATLALITEQTAAASGAFAREQDTLAGSTAVMGAKWDNIQAQLGKVLIPVITAVVTALSGLMDLIVSGMPIVWRAIQPVVQAIGRVFGSVFKTIGEQVRAVMTILDGLIDFVKAVFKGDWSAAWTAIQQIFGGIWDGIVSSFTAVPELFLSIVPGLLDAATDAGEAIINGILDGLGAAGGAVVSFAQDIGDAFRDFVNTHVIFPIRDFDFTILGKTFQPFGSLPTLGKGGIVTGPTLAILGERGREAVIPLDRGGLGNVFNINVSAGVGDPVRIGAAVVDAITAYERANGRRWRTAP